MIEFTPPSKSYQGYIFDCDGTLADSMPLHLRAWNAGLEAAKAPFQLDGKNFMSVAGMALRQTVEHWNETHTLQIDPDTVIAAKHAKPAPDLFLLAAERMGVGQKDCLVLEDSLLGIEAANKAGMESVLIPHPF